MPARPTRSAGPAGSAGLALLTWVCLTLLAGLIASSPLRSRAYPPTAARPVAKRSLAARPGAARLGAALAVGASAGAASPVAAGPAALAPTGEANFEAGSESITEQGILSDLTFLASEALEGRDSPSAGLAMAAEHLAAELASFGYKGAGPEDSFRVGFSRELPSPVASGCSLAAVTEQAGELTFELGTDFVPLWNASGSASGEAVFVTFGIESRKEKYDDVSGKLDGTIAVILSGEPNHKRKFEGSEITPAADLYSKLPGLAAAGVVGVLSVRRPPPAPAPKTSRRSKDDAPDPNPIAAKMGFRHTWAHWNDGTRPPVITPAELPVLEITPAVAQALLGFDVLEPGTAVDRSGKAPKPIHSGTVVELSAKSAVTSVDIHNVVGLLKGSDPELANEVVVIGAHYDHLGVDPRGRVAHGADDNGSGTAALLAVARALAAAQPRRTIMVAAFAAEEDNLVGSTALVDHCPVPTESIVAMINLDMIGFGKSSEVVVLGVPENPDMGKVLKRGKSLTKTGIRKTITGDGQELFQRSDHYPFHKAGIPTLFFFEGLPITNNRDYHLWTDTLDVVDLEKVTHTARLVFNVSWLLATDDDRPRPPKR